MINTKEDFSTTYFNLLSSHNYRGLVDLLSSTNFKDDNGRNTANALIEKFREQADIEDKLLEGVDDKTKKSYWFVTGGPNKSDWTDANGNIDTSLPSYRFSKAWNSLADENNNINIKFHNETEYGEFIKNLGGSEDKVRSNGINLNSDYSISFPTDINNKVGIYNALKASGIFDYIETENKDATNRNFYMGVSYEGGTGTDIGKLIVDDYGNMYSAGESGALTAKVSSNNKAFRDMQSAIEEANNDYAKIFETKDIKPYLNEMIVTGYMGEDDRELQKSFSAGLIDLQSFKEMRSILEEKYNRVLQTKSLSQYDVWSMNEDNEGSQVLEPLTDNITKSELDIEINEAIADGRLHFSHATNGADIGTMLVIDQKVDKDGKPVANSKYRRLFVKDLFRSQAESALRNDTQTAAQMEYSKHQTYRHAYRTISGETITDWNQDADGAVYTNKNGISEPLNKADILDVIDNDIIARRMIDYYKAANKTNENGRGYTQEYYKVYSNNGFNSKTLYDDISTKALAVAAKKYAGNSEDFIKYKAQELISIILKGIGANFDGELDNSIGERALTEFLTSRTNN